jgi:glycylpeptide N-tetradecanoyltransferase
MADDAKLKDTETNNEDEVGATESTEKGQIVEVESENEDEHEEVAEGAEGTVASSSAGKKKKSKRKRIKNAVMGSTAEPSNSGSSAGGELTKMIGGLSKGELAAILKMNPGLAQELLGVEGGNMSGTELAAAMKKLNVEEIMSGLASSGKNVKDMASYKFWQTQPVPKFGDNSKIEEGPFKIIDPDQVPKEPGALIDGFEWVTMDLTNDEEIQEVYTLLYGHYVEDDEAMFRFNYSLSFLKW